MSISYWESEEGFHEYLEYIRGKGVLKVRYNETCRCGQTVTVATLDSFRKTKDGVWRHKSTDDCITYLEARFTNSHSNLQATVQKQSEQLLRLTNAINRRWWQR